MIVYVLMHGNFGFNICANVSLFLQTYCLSPSHIFPEVSQALSAAQRYSDVRLLLDCIRKSPFASDALNDDVIMAAVKVLASQSREVGLPRTWSGM